MTINWTKGVFSSTFKLRKAEEPIGHLKISRWGSEGEGVINDQKFLFKPKGAFSKTVYLVDLATKKRIGEMTSNTFSSEKIIKLEHEEPLSLVKKGFWGRKWFLKRRNEVFMEIDAKDTKGRIKTEGPIDNIMMLSGLYGINQYYEYMAAIVVIIVVIMINQ